MLPNVSIMLHIINETVLINNAFYPMGTIVAVFFMK